MSRNKSSAEGVPTNSSVETPKAGTKLVQCTACGNAFYIKTKAKDKVRRVCPYCKKETILKIAPSPNTKQNNSELSLEQKIRQEMAFYKGFYDSQLRKKFHAKLKQIDKDIEQCQTDISYGKKIVVRQKIIELCAEMGCGKCAK